MAPRFPMSSLRTVALSRTHPAHGLIAPGVLFSVWFSIPLDGVIKQGADRDHRVHLVVSTGGRRPCSTLCRVLSDRLFPTAARLVGGQARMPWLFAATAPRGRGHARSGPDRLVNTAGAP